MKAYKEKLPVLVIGETAGSFLGEYQAGGVIIVLGLNSKKTPVGNFCGTGMHGGKIFIRGKKLPADLPVQVIAKEADEGDLAEIKDYLYESCIDGIDFPQMVPAEEELENNIQIFGGM